MPQGIEYTVSVPATFQAIGVGRTVVRVEEDLTAFLRTQQVLGSDVHLHHHRLIRSARPIPPAGQQVAARPPLEVIAWIVWGRDGLELVDTTAQAWAGRDVLVAVRDVRWPVLCSPSGRVAYVRRRCVSRPAA